jgi:hypothetical protein
MFFTFVFPCSELCHIFAFQVLLLLFLFHFIYNTVINTGVQVLLKLLQLHDTLKNSIMIGKIPSKPEDLCYLFYGIARNVAVLTGFLLWPYIYGHFLGSFFYGGISPSKIGLIAPYLERTQLCSKARVFLSS